LVTVTLEDTTSQLATSSTTPLNSAVHTAAARAGARLGSAVHVDKVVRVHDNTIVHNWEHCSDPVGPHKYAAIASKPTFAQLVDQLRQEFKADVDAAKAQAAASQRTADAALVPEVENLAVQVALYAAGTTILRGSKSTYFTQGPARSSHLVQLLADRGVIEPGQQLDALVTARNASTHPSDERELLSKVVRVRNCLTDGVRRDTQVACTILDIAEALIQGRGSGGSGNGGGGGRSSGGGAGRASSAGGGRGSGVGQGSGGGGGRG
jgi:hypothetical protein